MSWNSGEDLEDFKDEFKDVRTLSLTELKNDKSFQKIKQRSKLLYQTNEAINAKSDQPVPAEVSRGIKRKDIPEFQATNQAKKIDISTPKSTSSKSKIDKFSKIRGIKLTKARHNDLFDSLDMQSVERTRTNEASDVSAVPLVIDQSESHVTLKGETTTLDLGPTNEEDVSNHVFPIVKEVSGVNTQQEEDFQESNQQIQFDKTLKNGISDDDVFDLISDSVEETPEARGDDSNSTDGPQFQPTEDDVNSVKKQVMHQLLEDFTNVKESKLLSDKYLEIYRMFENTILHNEGHSVLLFGPRMCGKTSIINAAINELSHQHKDQFLVVRLNFFIHSDDTIALREIARQLDQKVRDLNDTVDEETGNFEQRSINDTFANILTILDKEVPSQTSSQGKIPIIFIIDEFEKFTNNNKQTLLYNLFDLSQSSNSAITVVGVSSKVTTRELLEKRVRSRFSQRIITINKPSTVDDFWSNAKLGLTLGQEFIQSLADPDYGHLWNNKIDQLYEDNEGKQQISNLKKLVYHNYYTIKNFKSFNNDCALVVANVNKANPFPDDADFLKYSACQEINNSQSIISTLSNLELILIISAARCVEKFDIPAINFNLAYAEYQEMMKDFNISTSTSTNILDSRFRANFKINQKIWSSKILKNSWEALYKSGILLDSAGVTTNNDGHIITNVNLNKNLIIEENKMVQIDVTLEELGNLVNDPIFKRLTKL